MTRLFAPLLAACLVARAAGAADTTAAPEAALLARLLGTPPLRAGICSLPRGGDGALALALARSGRLIVHAQDSRAEKVAAARAVADAAGLLGRQVYVEAGGLEALPFADNSVDLVVLADADAAALKDLSAAEVDRVLCPHGRAVVGAPTGLARAALEAWAGRGAVKNARISADASGVWAEWEKPLPAGTDDWSHWFHGPDNNPVSSDSVLRWPYATQWLGLPFHTPQPNMTLVADGRLFLFIGHGWMGYNTNDETLRAMRNRVQARNAYNGEVLWERKLPENFLVHRSGAVATAAALFLADGAGVLRLDPRTGAELGRVDLDAAGGEVKWMALSDGRLFFLAGDRDPPLTDQTSRYGTLGKNEQEIGWGFGTRIGACDLAAGKVVWRHEEPQPVDARAIGLQGGKLFLYAPGARLACLDAATGRTLWANEGADAIRTVEEPAAAKDNLLISRTSAGMLCLPDLLTLHLPARRSLAAFDAADGKLRWSFDTGAQRRWGRVHQLALDGALYTSLGGAVLDTATGEKRKQPFSFGATVCGRMTASPDAVYGQKGRGLDRTTGKSCPGQGLKTGCYDATIPACGLLFGTPHSCLCPVSVRGLVCFGPTAQPARGASYRPEGSQLEAAAGGAAVRPPAALDVTPEDWPLYRANVGHTACSVASLPSAASLLWRSAVTGEVATAPVAAGGLVFVGRDSGRIEALDAATGKRAWSHPTAGRIVGAPAVAGGRVFAGAGDGWLYALEATSGRLLWRFRPAARPRRTMVHGYLRDTASVQSVLVHEGTVYAAAGIHFLDGTDVFALDAATGRVKWQNGAAGHLDEAVRIGATAGELTIAGGRLWMAGGGYAGAVGFDLKDGSLQPAEFDWMLGRTQSGEIGVFRGDYLCVGGAFPARLPWERKGEGATGVSFLKTTAEGDARYPAVQAVTSTFIMPAWDDAHIVLTVDNAAGVGVWDAAKVQAMLDGVEKTTLAPEHWKRPKTVVWKRTHSPAFLEDPVPPWLWGPEKREVCAVALARNAAVVAWALPGASRNAPPAGWRLAALEADSGRALWEADVPCEPLPGALCIDRNGRVLLALRDGSIACFGAPPAAGRTGEGQ